MTRCIVARYTDISNPDDQQFYHGHSKPTSHVKYVSSNLEWINDLQDIVRLDISCNYISSLDLSPLADCKTLKYLDLSENAIEEIDLGPLNSCSKLETLDLSYNRMTDVNLTPIVNCEKLRYFYLHSNKLDTINIAPLHQLKKLEKVIIDTLRDKAPTPVYRATHSDHPPNLNDVLYAMTFTTARPEWLVGSPNVKIIRMKADSYALHVSKHGWKSVKKHLQAAREFVSPKRDFEAQNAILADLGIPELSCYDGSVSDIIDLIPTSGTYEEGVLELQTGLISLLTKQLENGGSTLFFDIDKLATTPGSVLVPLIVSQREKELSNIVLYQYEDRVNLMPIWLTGFGFNILRALGSHRVGSALDVPNLLNRFSKELGVEISLKRTTSRRKFESLGSSPSEALTEHIYTIIH